MLENGSFFYPYLVKINVNEGNMNKLERSWLAPAPVQQQLKCVNNHVLLPLVLLKQAGWHICQPKTVYLCD